MGAPAVEEILDAALRDGREELRRKINAELGALPPGSSAADQNAAVRRAFAATVAA